MKSRFFGFVCLCSIFWCGFVAACLLIDLPNDIFWERATHGDFTGAVVMLWSGFLFSVVAESLIKRGVSKKSKKARR